MSTFYSFYPPASGGISTNGSIGPTGDPVPSEATLIGGENPSGDLTAVQVNSSGEILAEISVIPLPPDAATESKQDDQIAQLDDVIANTASIDTKTPALGQALMAASSPVVIASNQSAVPVSAAALPLPSGAATEATLSTLNGKVTAVNTGAVVVASSALPTGAATEATLSTLNGKVTAVNTGAVVVASSALPSGASTEATLAAASAKLPITLGQKAMAASMAVVIASDQTAVPASQSGTWTVQPGNTANTTPWLVKQQVAAAATLSNVSSSATSVTLSASNSSRLSWYVYNDSTQVLYVKFGATASATSYTVQIPAAGYYEMPFPTLYTGVIDGIWASANGNARVTEI